MNWNTVPIVERESRHPNESAPDIPQATAGLGVTPDTLHNRFMSELDHLEDAMSLHQTVVGEHAGDIESRFDNVAGVLRIDAFLDLLGGSEKDGGLVIPLHGCELSGINLSMGEVNGLAVFRLELATGQGQRMERLFSLPTDCNLANAIWTAGELHLNLDRNQA